MCNLQYTNTLLQLFTRMYSTLAQQLTSSVNLNIHTTIQQLARIYATEF